MWNKLTYEHKTYALLGGLLLVLLIGYYSSIQKTYASYEENQKLKNVGQRTSIAEFSELQRKFTVLDSTYSIISDIDYDKLLIADVSRLINQHKVGISALQNEKNNKTEVDVLTLVGPFKELIKVVYYLERHFYVGKVFSTRFQLVRDNKTKVSSLYLDIYIQRLQNETVD